jgi:nucleotide-binding universal stress UspA family protein
MSGKYSSRSWMPMFRAIAVGTDGKETADKAVGVALVTAERYQRDS